MTRIALRGPADALLAAADGPSGPIAHPLVAVLIAVVGSGPDCAALLAQARAAADHHDRAFLIEDDCGMAAALSADGVEIAWSPEAFAAARKAVGTDRTVGCRVGLNRHHAMLAAEAGADYVAFSAPRGGDDGFARLVEMTAWWAEIFEVPVLASGARTPSEAARLAAAGADFVDAPPDLWGAGADLVAMASGR